MSDATGKVIPRGKPDLRRVTICAADCVHPRLAGRALERSAALCDFGDVILFCDEDVTGDFRTVKIDRLTSIDAYSGFIFNDLVRHIKTDFVLIVQWDGFVIDANAWQDQFLNYDYIGARWPWQKDGLDVGNGGFSLRSSKLLRTLANPRYRIIEDVAEDEMICRLYHHWLTTEDGIRFAPGALADQFAYEREKPDAPTFGFHGLFNMWRHVEDQEMVQIAETFTPGNFMSREFFELFLQYYLFRKFVPLVGLYRIARSHASFADVVANMKRFISDDAMADNVCALCEKYL